MGDVILHGKKKYWMRGGNFHYHLGLQAGENTLEAQLVRVLSKSIQDRGIFDVNDFRERYMKFMTTPGSHNDTYASTCHRMFFANAVRGVSKNPLHIPFPTPFHTPLHIPFHTPFHIPFHTSLYLYDTPNNAHFCSYSSTPSYTPR